MFISAVKFGILTWGSLGIDSLLGPTSSGHLKNCSFWHFSIGLTFQPQRSPLGNTVCLDIFMSIICAVMAMKMSHFYTAATSVPTPNM